MKKYFRRFISGAVALVVLSAVMSGCNNSGSAATPTPSQFENISLDVVTSFGPNDGGRAAFVELCEEFEHAAGVNIIDGSADSTEEWKTGVIASFASGSEPDVLFYFTGVDTEELIKNNRFVSLDEIQKEYPDYASNINLTILESLEALDGKGYAVPVKGYWERLFINKDIFDELNLEPPKTYEDLFELAPVLIQAGYIPIAASLKEVPHYLFEALLFNQTGPSKHHSIPADSGNIPQSWISAMEQFAVMYEAGMFPEDAASSTHTQAFELFQSKKAAMIIDGDWTVAQIRDKENTIVVNFPSGANNPRKSTDLISGFSMGFYITQRAWDDEKKRAVAAEFVQFITSEASILKLNVSGAAVPIVGFSAGNEAQSNQTPLLKSIGELNEETTAFVGATADRFRPEAREWLFSRILSLSKGEVSAENLLKEFIALNNGE